MLGLFLIFSLFALLVDCTFVYRADNRTPDEIKKDGGFKSWAASNGKTPDTSLYNHMVMPSSVDPYVSTSLDREVCDAWVQKNFKGNGYVYEISADQHFIPLAETLGEFYSYSHQKEVAAQNKIAWTYISEWTQYVDGKPQPVVKNTEFDEKTTSLRMGGPRMDLAGFPAVHRAWKVEPWKSMKENPNKPAQQPEKTEQKKVSAVDKIKGLFSGKSKKGDSSKSKRDNVIKKRDTISGRRDLAHFAQIRAAKAATDNE